MRRPSSRRCRSCSDIGQRVRTDEFGDEYGLAAGGKAGAHLLAQHFKDAVVVAEHLRTEVIGDHLQTRVPIETIDKTLDGRDVVLIQRIEADFHGNVHRASVGDSKVYRSGDAELARVAALRVELRQP